MAQPADGNPDMSSSSRIEWIERINAALTFQQSFVRQRFGVLLYAGIAALSTLAFAVTYAREVVAAGAAPQNTLWICLGLALTALVILRVATVVVRSPGRHITPSDFRNELAKHQADITIGIALSVIYGVSVVAILVVGSLAPRLLGIVQTTFIIDILVALSILPRTVGHHGLRHWHGGRIAKRMSDAPRRWRRRVGHSAKKVTRGVAMALIGFAGLMAGIGILMVVVKVAVALALIFTTGLEATVRLGIIISVGAFAIAATALYVFLAALFQAAPGMMAGFEYLRTEVASGRLANHADIERRFLHIYAGGRYPPATRRGRFRSSTGVNTTSKKKPPSHQQ